MVSRFICFLFFAGSFLVSPLTPLYGHESGALVSKILISSTDKSLHQKAQFAKDNAFIPGGRTAFQVGALIRFSDDSFTTGSNVKLPCGLTQCAERVALFQHLVTHKTQRERPKIKAIYVANSDGKESHPCGICLQALSHFATPETYIVFQNETGALEKIKLFNLIPRPYKWKYS